MKEKTIEELKEEIQALKDQATPLDKERWELEHALEEKLKQPPVSEEEYAARVKRIRTRTAKGLLKQLIEILKEERLIRSDETKALCEELVSLLLREKSSL